MKFLKLLILVLIVAISSLQAQDADKIISNYFENTGGYDNWGEVKGIKTTMKLQQGTTEIPIESVQLADGRQYNKITFQGTSIFQGVYDGEILWGTNMQTMKIERADPEMAERQKLNENDFPSPLYNYKEKGYTVELIGKETIEDTETYKIKLIKEPVSVDGAQVDDVTYYYFDTEKFITVMQETEIQAGPQKGAVVQVVLSDYQEVDGLYFPFSMTRGLKDGASQPMTIDAIELNPTVDDSVFSYPKEGE